MRDRFRILDSGELQHFTCRSRVVEHLLAYWLSKQQDDPQNQGGRPPLRSAIDPAELKPILPHIMLVDLSHEPFRARYRLVGTAVVEHTKLDFTSYYADDILFQDEDGIDWNDCYRQVMLAMRPGFGISHWSPDKDFVRWTEFLICPLLGADGELSQCISAEEYEPLPDHMEDSFRARPI
jgi:hypothetical protein